MIRDGFHDGALRVFAAIYRKKATATVAKTPITAARVSVGQISHREQRNEVFIDDGDSGCGLDGNYGGFGRCLNDASHPCRTGAGGRRGGGGFLCQTGVSRNPRWCLTPTAPLYRSCAATTPASTLSIALTTKPIRRLRSKATHWRLPSAPRARTPSRRSRSCPTCFSSPAAWSSSLATKWSVSIGAAARREAKLDDGCAKAGNEKIRDRLK